MKALQGVPVRRIIAAISDAADRWSDADFPARVRLLDRIAERTGYTIPVVEYALDQLFFSITRASLAETIDAELGTLDVLDAFARRTDEMEARAMPVGRVCVISSRTTIGVAIVPAIFALCAKCDVVVKDREDGLVRAFFSSLYEELDEFGTAATAESWNGDEGGVDLASFEAVAAFGNDATMEAIRRRTSATARFIPFGSKASIGYVGRQALHSFGLHELAANAARDVVLYESEGCVSLHALFVERGGNMEPAQFARAVAQAIERASIEFPPGTRDAGTVAKIAAARNLAAFRSASGSGAVYSDETASYLTVLDPPQDDAPPFLPRALPIHAVDGPPAALNYVRRHELPVEAIAIAGEREDILNMAIEMGVNRITKFGELQRPPLSETHGGRPRIGEFVRWVVKEA